MSKDLLNRNKRKAKQFEKLQNGFMRIFKIEYAQKASDESQFVEIRASNADSARRIFYGKHRDLPTIYEIKEKVENNSDPAQKLIRKEYRRQKGLLKDAEHKAKKRLKHIKNKMWKLKHPDKGVLEDE